MAAEEDDVIVGTSTNGMISWALETGVEDDITLAVSNFVTWLQVDE